MPDSEQLVSCRQAGNDWDVIRSRLVAPLLLSDLQLHPRGRLLQLSGNVMRAVCKWHDRDNDTVDAAGARFGSIFFSGLQL
jgi:hypothetical protein